MSISSISFALTPPALTSHAPVQRSLADAASPVAWAAARRVPTSEAAPHMLMAPLLVIEFDGAAERFVQTLIDPTDKSVLRRFPAEDQIAFSRGVNAYMTAQLRADGLLA